MNKHISLISQRFNSKRNLYLRKNFGTSNQINEFSISFFFQDIRTAKCRNIWLMYSNEAAKNK